MPEPCLSLLRFQKCYQVIGVFFEISYRSRCSLNLPAEPWTPRVQTAGPGTVQSASLLHRSYGAVAPAPPKQKPLPRFLFRPYARIRFDDRLRQGAISPPTLLPNFSGRSYPSLRVLSQFLGEAQAQLSRGWPNRHRPSVQRVFCGGRTASPVVSVCVHCK